MITTHKRFSFVLTSRSKLEQKKKIQRKKKWNSDADDFMVGLMLIDEF